MKLIVGLGNLGKEYEGTRHNAGFMFIDKIVCADEFSPVGECITFHTEEKFQALIAETLHRGEKIILAKPETFMNHSGLAVSKILDYFCIDYSNLIVISDDIDLPIGHARVRQEGSSGGHKGLQSIIENLGTDKFTRIRLGINSLPTTPETDQLPPKIDSTDFVLAKFSKREIPVLNELIDDAIEYVMPFIGSKTEIPAHSLQITRDSLQG